ncbi:MAG: sugar transferase [Chthoniobacterales bacterium]|nr:sugar transferase [Chthoniobacterales bacterium]
MNHFLFPASILLLMSTETLNYTQAMAALPHWWKRPLDLLVIALLLPLWGPVMILVALWIKLVSPGPIIYRQQRIGFLQRPFTMFKFRSMKVSAETSSHESHFSHLIKSDAPMTKLDAVGDSRLISLGAVLRAAGLDELPQIFNVIRGEMSLVGPRPCTPYELQHYDTDHLARADLPPGLTGYWQVNGKNSTTFKQMIKMDMFYAKNASLRLDLSILAKTIAVLTSQLFGPGPSRSAD